MPVVTMDRVSIAFGHLPILDQARLEIDRGERVALVGPNGAGKSTLLGILSGEIAADSGMVIWRDALVRVARLEQDVPPAVDRSVVEVVADGHRPPPGADDDWNHAHLVDRILSRLHLDPGARIDTLSGGWRRRVMLARALVDSPDLLLLDEPTNHLDIDAIEWLEAFLAGYPGAVLFVTHDRRLLQGVATRIVELDRGRLISWPGDYDTFLELKDAATRNEQIQNEKFDRKLAIEEIWIRRGIRARRTRDEGRVQALVRMRAERASRRQVPGRVEFEVEQADPTGKIVFEARGISKVYGGIPVIGEFSTRVVRGDRIGLIGPNGSGKTALLRILLGECSPDSGTIRRGTHVKVAYFDQQREQLDPERTVFDIIGEGSDTVTSNGRTRHVHAYLDDFLFPRERARSPVKALSGGERNRLLLARLFTRESNVLVLDEPTNDLDIDTLELLEDRLVEWTGTLILVSHDRALLDNLVTSTWVFERDARVSEYVGGYSDWLGQRPEPAVPDKTRKAAVSERDPRSPRPGKRSFNEQRELDALPGTIESLEAEQRALSDRIAGPDFFRESAGAIKAELARLELLEGLLAEAYDRWAELDSRGA
jgi:ATP-binding cassette subfamily F protein uup